LSDDLTSALAETSPNDGPTANGPNGQVEKGPSHATFQNSLETNSVRLGNVVSAKAMASPRLTKDPATRATGEYFYPLLLAAFQQRHKGVQIVIQEYAGLGVALHTGDEDEVGDRLDTAVIRRTMRFDWSAARALLTEAHELAEETRRWIAKPAERRDLLGLLLGIVSQIQATIARENRQCPEDQDESIAPTARMDADLENIKHQLSAAREQFERDTQRAAQFRYARGIALGAGIMMFLCAVIASIFALEHVKAINGVGLVAGAVGACVSVLQRMTKGTLDLNAQAGHKMIVAFGALRPFVGGIFGLVTFFVIRAELISVFVLPKATGTALAYVAVFAFVAGFNERFFQDMLANASNARNETA
jgi:hypothetical protein